MEPSTFERLGQFSDILVGRRGAMADFCLVQGMGFDLLESRAKSDGRRIRGFGGGLDDRVFGFRRDCEQFQSVWPGKAIYQHEERENTPVDEPSG